MPANFRLAGHARASELARLESPPGVWQRCLRPHSSAGYSGEIAAIAKHPDEITDLKEAGVGCAEDVCDELLPRIAS